MAGATAIVLLALTMGAWSQPSHPIPGISQDTLRKLEDEEIGVSLTGKAKSEFLRSALSGESANPEHPVGENAAFTQADIGLIARPSAHTRGRVYFRVHQDWQNHYPEGPNPISTRWFDYGGSIIDGKVEFAIGDVLQKYSPLTIYSPEPELLYEPEIFARRRQNAMDEWFLADNRRPIQGLNAVYRQGLGEVLGFEAGLTGGRLRSADPGVGLGWLFNTGPTEKFMGGTFLKLRAFEALEIGGTHVRAVDDIGSSRARSNVHFTSSKGVLPQVLYENVLVNAINLNFDGEHLLASRNLTLKLGLEVAFSNYRRSREGLDTLGYYPDSTLNPQSGMWTPISRPLTGPKLIELQALDGNALNAGLEAGYTSGESLFAVGLKVGFLRNGNDFVNDLAQSPAFIGGRVLNSKNGVEGIGGYSTFDALYHHVYNVDPITNINTSEFWGQGAAYQYNGTNNWYRAPTFKNSYTRSTLTKLERESLAGALDPHVQLLLPYGPATPNRSGLTLDLEASFLESKIEVRGLYAGLQELEGRDMDTLITSIATYGRLGGGLSVQAGEFLKLSRPLALSGSYIREGRNQPAFTDKGISVSQQDFQSAMVNAGVQVGVSNNLILSAGYQQIASNPYRETARDAGSRTFDELDLVQSQWSVGLEIKLTHGAYVTAEYGVLDLDESVTGTRFSQNLSSLFLTVTF